MLKNLVDFILAFVLLLFFFPLLLIVAMAITVSMGRPVFFKQERAGKGGKPFRLVKFRTMNLKPGSLSDFRAEALRITRLGRLLRKTSIDELPSLFNVLKGEMSLVGPRPLPLAYVARYNESQKMRLNVKPGITGWAQINGRNQITWEEKFQLDTFYVKNRSLYLDVKILFLTVLKVLKREGVEAVNSEIIPEFKPG